MPRSRHTRFGKTVVFNILYPILDGRDAAEARPKGRVGQLRNPDFLSARVLSFGCHHILCTINLFPYSARVLVFEDVFMRRAARVRIFALERNRPTRPIL